MLGVCRGKREKFVSQFLLTGQKICSKCSRESIELTPRPKQGDLVARLSVPDFFSCSFPKLRDKIWNRTPGFEARDLVYNVHYCCRLINLDDRDTRLFHMLQGSTVSIHPVPHRSLHTVAASIVGEHFRTLGVQPSSPVSSERRTCRHMGYVFISR